MTMTTAARCIGLLSLSVLIACSGSGSNPVTGGLNGADPIDPGTTPPPGTIPDDLANNLTGVTFDPGNATLTLQLSSLDDGDDPATYTRNAALDIPGYQAFTRQDDSRDRFFLALSGVSGNSEVRAVVVTDGGQFNRFFGGGYYERNGPYVQPTANTPTGLVSYAGTYAASTNINAPGANLEPPPPGTPAGDLPNEPEPISGRIFLNVDFANNAVNGNISSRQFVNYGTPLSDVVLVDGVIASDGTFAGGTEFPDLTPNGTFGGVFGGDQASAVAGVVHTTDFDEDLENEQEYGVFVLDRCGTANEDPIGCAGTNP